ncbi:MAG: hypothetical protein AAFO07_03425, partial [Bacteroidota bacterium]
MRKLVFAVVLVVVCTQLTYAQERFIFGGGITTIYNPFELGVQAKVKYDINQRTGTSAAVNYYLDKVVNWGFDLDQHYNDFIRVGEL